AARIASSACGGFELARVMVREDLPDCAAAVQPPAVPPHRRSWRCTNACNTHIYARRKYLRRSWPAMPDTAPTPPETPPPQPPVPPADPAARRRAAVAFVGLLLAVVPAVLDIQIAATALPTILAELGGVAQVAWVGAGFMLASSIAMPLAGKL